MNRFLAASIAALVGTTVYADPAEVGDWRQANERVQEAGGWKAYAREIDAAQVTDAATKTNGSDVQKGLSLEQAIERARALEPNLQQTLHNISREPRDYLSLTDQQRNALTRDAQLVAEVQSLYFSAVAAQERVNYQIQVVEAASVASELASRMRAVGNLNMLHQAEEQLSFAQTQKNLSHARVLASAAREALIRRLQLSGPQAEFSLPSRLPELPNAQPSTAGLSRVDARLMSASITNPSLIRVQSEARQVLIARDEAHALARHYRDEILPLQKRISEEHLLHYNGMIIGIFELLKDAKAQVHAVEGYLNALNAYWQAQSMLEPKLFALREHLSQIRRDAWN